MKRFLSPGLVLLLFAACMVSTLWAQGQGTGSVEGVLTDSSGGVIPEGEVTIRNLGTNAVRAVVNGLVNAGYFPLHDPGEHQQHSLHRASDAAWSEIHFLSGRRRPAGARQGLIPFRGPVCSNCARPLRSRPAVGTCANHFFSGPREVCLCAYCHEKSLIENFCRWVT